MQLPATYAHNTSGSPFCCAILASSYPDFGFQIQTPIKVMRDCTVPAAWLGFGQGQGQVQAQAQAQGQGQGQGQGSGGIGLSTPYFGIDFMVHAAIYIVQGMNGNKCYFRTGRKTKTKKIKKQASLSVCCF